MRVLLSYLVDIAIDAFIDESPITSHSYFSLEYLFGSFVEAHIWAALVRRRPQRRVDGAIHREGEHLLRRHWLGCAVLLMQVGEKLVLLC